MWCCLAIRNRRLTIPIWQRKIQSQTEGIANEILMFFRGAKKAAQNISLNEPIDTDKDGNTLTLLDTMATDDNILEDIDLRMKTRRLYDVLGRVLSPREREIIVLRYGLSGQRPLVQREVAKKLRISRSYISRLEKKALEKLRGQFGDTDYFSR